MSRVADRTGQRFGKLVALEPVKIEGKNRTYWKCLCDCGNTTVTFTGNLPRGMTTSCGCSKRLIGEIFKKRPYESIYGILVREAKEGLVHTLSFEQFLEFTNISECHYCGSPIKWTKHNVGYNGGRYNLDRKNNNLGYSPDNCVVCCVRCNRAKSNAFTYEQWCVVGQAMRATPSLFREE